VVAHQNGCYERGVASVATASRGLAVGSVLTVSEVVSSHARLRPGKVGVGDTRGSLSYVEWDERAGRLAHGFSELGLCRGDRVAVLAYNCVEWGVVSADQTWS
jgi:non-ribosomal peptide synthetase component E (peptide arylation enzyme)